MLERIITTFKEYHSPLSVALLSSIVQVEPSALAGMLTMLERKGRIETVKIDEGLGQCRTCLLQKSCTTEQKWYRLVE